MAELTLILRFGERIPISEIDLNSVTNAQLIEALIQVEILEKPDISQYSWYHLFDKDENPIYEVDTLSNLGFKDVDSILILKKPIG